MDILPGLLYSSLKVDYPRMEKTAVAQIPSTVRGADENLKYQPTVEFRGQWGTVRVADCSVQIRINYPYPGWKEVKPRVERILSEVMNTGLIVSYERISILYHNIISTESGDSDLSALELTMHMGRDMKNPWQNTLLRTELPHDCGVSIVQLQTGAQAQIAVVGQPTKIVKGAHLSVDTIALGGMESFEQIKERLELVHKVERGIFFSMVKEDTWKRLGPVWEN